MAKKKQISLGSYMKRFSTEAKCREYLTALRWKNGYTCPKCGSHHAHSLKNGLYQCAKCRHQTSVTAGTVLHKTHMPLTKWFLAFYFVCYDKRGVSAVQLALIIGTTYKTAWFMLKRIRSAMGQRDQNHQLCGIIEFDDTYFGGASIGKKRGRGTEKTSVFVALSLDKRENPLYLKMRVVSDLKKETVEEFALSSFAAGSTVRSDGYGSYIPGLKGFTHEHKPYDPNSGLLHWLHIVISNAKAFTLGTYHGLPKKNLQSYLDEFCFRFSRRYLGSALVERLLLAMGLSARLS